MMNSENDQRVEGRARPLFAEVKYQGVQEGLFGEDVFLGVCKNISASGMLVQAHINIGYPGAAIQVSVSPPRHSKIRPFKARAQIVRLIEDPAGFALQFVEIPEDSRQEIRDFVSMHGANKAPVIIPAARKI